MSKAAEDNNFSVSHNTAKSSQSKIQSLNSPAFLSSFISNHKYTLQNYNHFISKYFKTNGPVVMLTILQFQERHSWQRNLRTSIAAIQATRISARDLALL